MGINLKKKTERAVGKYTSVSGMHSKNQVNSKHHVVGTIIHFLLLVACCLLLTAYSSAEIIDRVVAFVDERAITLTELEKNYKDMIKLKPDIRKEEVLNTMINRILLLEEAKKLRIEAQTKDETINEYIELKLKTTIKITEQAIRDFYENNKTEFGRNEFDDVRDLIEDYLTEKELNEKLKRHIEELKTKAYIKIHLNPQ
jgi:hypothetical protein